MREDKTRRLSTLTAHSLTSFSPSLLLHLSRRYNKAASQEHVVAQYNLGICFRYGKMCVEQDNAKAVEWFTKAANQGYANAQFELGLIFILGNDLVKAHMWLTKAADQGHIDADIQRNTIPASPAPAITNNDVITNDTGLKIVSGKVYEIKNMCTGFETGVSYLRAANKEYGKTGNKFYTATGHQSKEDGTSLWKLTAQGDDTYTIKSMYKGKAENQRYLGVTSEAYNEGNEFFTSIGPDCGVSTQWKLTSQGDDKFTIKSMFTGKKENQSYLLRTRKEYWRSKCYVTRSHFTTTGPKRNDGGWSLWKLTAH